MLIAAACVQGGTLLASIVVANVVGVSGFGVFGFFQSTLNTLAMFAQASTGLMATRYLPQFLDEDSEKAGGLLAVGGGSALGLASVISAGLVVWVVADASKAFGLSETNSVLLIVAAVLPAAAMNLFLNGALIGLSQLRRPAWLNLILTPFAIGLPFLGALCWGAVGAAIGVSFTLVLRCLGSGWILRTDLRTSSVRISAGAAKSVLPLLKSFALPATLTGVAVLLANWGVSIIVISQEGGPRELGILAAALSIKAIALFVPAQLAIVGLATVSTSNLRHSPERSLQVRRAILLLCLACALIVVTPLAIIGDRTFQLFGSDFHGALLLRLVLASAIVEAVAVAIYQQLPAQDQMWRSFLIVSIPRDCIIFLGSLLLVPALGAIGAAVALLLGQCVACVGTIIALKRGSIEGQSAKSRTADV